MLYQLAKQIFDKFPTLRPLLRIGKRFVKRGFSGWGMTTIHPIPWENDQRFLESCRLVSKFEFTKHVAIEPKDLPQMYWRFWVLTFAARVSNGVIVECGVGDGLSSFFILRETGGMMHLYDTFGALRESDILEHETAVIYGGLNVDRTKKNLTEFKDRLVFHVGYIPNTLNDTAPDGITLLHLDLTTRDSYLQALKFFFPRLAKNGVIIFDDVGRNGYQNLRDEINKILNNQLFVLPTGQALYFKHG